MRHYSYPFQNEIRRKSMSENKGLQALEARVTKRDLCTNCGACSSLCPYLRPWQGRIVKVHDCDLTEGRCFAYCPRTEVDLEAIHRAVFNRSYQDLTMGPVRGVLMARSKERKVRRKAQTGGLVSSLMAVALREGLIQAAVLTQRDKGHLPQGRVVRSQEEVLACAGSSYVAGATLEALNRGPWDGTERIGVVGTPCQVLALGKMRAATLEPRTVIDRISLVVGLFCTWALMHGPFLSFLKERVNGAPIGKLDITPPPDRILKVSTKGRVLDIALDEIRPFIRPSCSVCLDMTSELSDLSVGTVEGVEGWNTLLVRTETGEALLGKAEALGAVETRPLPDENLAHLEEASMLKKRRALSALKERGELESGYVTLSSEMTRRILANAAEVIS
jgi:coenzyme F420 hydrogenase subunit beta